MDSRCSHVVCSGSQVQSAVSTVLHLIPASLVGLPSASEMGIGALVQIGPLCERDVRKRSLSAGSID